MVAVCKTSTLRAAYAGELLAIIAPDNLASQNVCRKLGFTFWKQAPVEGDIRNLHTLPAGKPASLARPARPRKQRVLNGSAGGLSCERFLDRRGDLLGDAEFIHYAGDD
jgi:hypothetical protein